MPTHDIVVCENVNVIFTYSSFEYSTFKEYVFQKLKGQKNTRSVAALSNVSVRVARGESVALVGHNGSGKSTLLKVLAGIIQPQKGSRVEIQGRVAPMIELGTGFDGELSGLENIFLSCSIMGLKRSEITRKLEDIIEFSELEDYMHMPVKNFSSGMQARLGFACTTAVDPDVLLVDEVLAVGDANFAKKCLDRVQKLRADGTTIVLVSHDPNVVRTFCDRAYVFDSGKIRFAGEIIEALRAHDSIMEERRMAALSHKEREELKRQQLLSDDEAERSRGAGSKVPSVFAILNVIQDDKSKDSVDWARPFKLRFLLNIKNAEYFGEDLSFGIALFTDQGIRVGGMNNFETNYRFETEKIRDAKRLLVTMDFNEGAPNLLAGHYKLFLGIHDHKLTRTVLYQDLGALTCVNSRFDFNFDRDIVHVGSYLKGFSVCVNPNQQQLTLGSNP